MFFIFFCYNEIYYVAGQSRAAFVGHYFAIKSSTFGMRQRKLLSPQNVLTTYPFPSNDVNYVKSHNAKYQLRCLM